MVDRITTHIEINREGFGNSTTGGIVRDCSTGYYEGSDMMCHHPKEGTKEFLKMEMKDCYKYSDRPFSFGTKAKIAGEKRKVLQCSKKAK